MIIIALLLLVPLVFTLGFCVAVLYCEVKSSRSSPSSCKKCDQIIDFAERVVKDHKSLSDENMNLRKLNDLRREAMELRDQMIALKEHNIQVLRLRYDEQQARYELQEKSRRSSN